MNIAQIKALLARQSTAALSQMRSQYLGIAAHIPATKAQMIDALAVHFDGHGVPPHLSATVTPAAPAPVAPDRIATLEGTLKNLDAAVAAEVSNITQALNANATAVTRVKGDMANVARDIVNVHQAVEDLKTDTAKQLSAIADAVNQNAAAQRTAVDQLKATLTIDPNAVEASIARAVQAGFGAFEAKVQANGTAAAIVEIANAPKVIARKSALDVFGIEVNDQVGAPLMFDIWDDASTPAVDPDFLWTEEAVLALAGALAGDFNLWLGGDKGVGKSETARQFAARTGRAFTRINFQKYSEGADFLGATGILPDGSTGFVAGDFLKAYTHPGTVCLLDEISNCQPGALAVLNGLLEPRSHQNIGGQFWTKAKGVFILGADNTLGTGDESGQFGGTNEMNAATLDRFQVIHHMEWLPPSVESEAIARRTGCKPALADAVVQCLTAARAKVRTGDIVSAPSIRAAISFVTLAPIMGVDRAWAASIANRQPSEGAAALEAIRATHLNGENIRNLI